MYLHELLLDRVDLDFDDCLHWLVRDPQKPCAVLSDLGSLVIVATLRMNAMEPEDDNMVFVRVPI